MLMALQMMMLRRFENQRLTSSSILNLTNFYNEAVDKQILTALEDALGKKKKVIYRRTYIWLQKNSKIKFPLRDRNIGKNKKAETSIILWKNYD